MTLKVYLFFGPYKNLYQQHGKIHELSRHTDWEQYATGPFCKSS